MTPRLLKTSIVEQLGKIGRAFLAAPLSRRQCKPPQLAAPFDMSHFAADAKLPDKSSIGFVLDRKKTRTGTIQNSAWKIGYLRLSIQASLAIKLHTSVAVFRTAL